MDIVVNLAVFEHFFNLPPEQMLWSFLANFAWVFFGITFIYGALLVWLNYIRTKWSQRHKFVLLAIDIPRGNEQSPKAVENMFTYLGGAHGSQNFYEKWFAGEYQKTFSYEIVSLEGYTQFLIRTPVEFRNLVESSVYSQYPDAEISEVDDYTQNVPQKYPDDEWDVFGSEFILQDSWYLPIRSYPDFEHPMGPSETQFKDPMASLMDLCSSLRSGEQLWMQIIIEPTGFDWVKEAMQAVDKIMGRKKKAKKSLAMKGVEALGEASEIIYPIWGDISGDKKEEKAKTMLDLSPKEKEQVEGIYRKATKLGFNAKLRVVYVARKEVMDKAKVFNGFVGYIKQFGALGMNSFKPDVKVTMTKAVYFRKKPRLIRKKRNLFHNYINRSTDGRELYLLNIEELATLWHFPIEANVKSPLIQKAPGRKADAPSSLPIIEEEMPLPVDIFTGLSEGSENKEKDLLNNDFESSGPPPPENLPFV